MGVAMCDSVQYDSSARSNPQEALKGEILKGDIQKWDFALKLAIKFALDTSILTALSKVIPQGSIV